ncbi:hypothetical protein D3C81_1561310 [compost metagenome]
MLSLTQVFGQQLARTRQSQLCTTVFKGCTGMAQRFQMATTSTEAAFRSLLVAHTGLEVITQEFQTITCRFGAQADRHVAIFTDFQGNGFTSQVCFVTNQRNLGRIRAGFEEFRPQGKRIQCFRSGCIDHQQDAIRFADGFQCAFNANLFHLVFGITQTCGIHNVQRHTVDVDMFTQNIAGGAGNLGDDRRFPTG